MLRLAGMERHDFTGRLAWLRSQLAARDLEAHLVSGPENRRYLSGFTATDELLTETSGYLLITREHAFLLTDFRYREWALAEAVGWQVVIYQKSLGETLAEVLAEEGIRRLGFEPAYLSVRQYERLTQAAAQAGLKVEWLPQESLVEQAREIKEPAEVAAIREALRLTEGVLTEVAGLLAPGLTEGQVAWEIEKRLREAGAEGLAFAPIVAAGKNSARPHHRPGDTPLRPGEPIIIDLGCRVAGYCSDLTRTFILGEPTPRFREIYDLVRRAQRRAEAGLRAGLTSDAADALGREVIRQAGYGEFFGHSLGHGVGLAVHEAPSLSPHADRATVLKAGSVVTVEPGIYLPEWGGVRLENLVILHDTHAEVLTRMGYYEW
ncbi:MAG: aminopeptidase P family protein [Desulfobaccales bacterium]